jgi:hypothetical protein
VLSYVLNIWTRADSLVFTVNEGTGDGGRDADVRELDEVGET